MTTATTRFAPVVTRDARSFVCHREGDAAQRGVPRDDETTMVWWVLELMVAAVLVAIVLIARTWPRDAWEL